MELMQNIWNIEDQMLLERLKKDVLLGPTLEIPDPSKRFYIKTDRSTYGMGAVILQSDVSEEARNSEAQEKDNGKCAFDKFMEVMHLQPIFFI